MAVADSLEGVFTEIGFGKWQGLILGASLLFHAVIPVQQLGSTLLSAPVPFRCSYEDDVILMSANATSSERGVYAYNINGNNNQNEMKYSSQCFEDINNSQLNYSQYDEGPFESEVSKIHLGRYVTGIPSCPMIEYDTSVFESTVISEWNLVCENTNYRPLFQMTYAIGSIIGSLFCGQLSDWVGRKRTLQLGGILILSAVVGVSICPWYWVMIVLRILSGIGTTVVLFPIYTLISEVCPPSHRVLTSIIPGMTYFVFMSAFGGIAYFVPHWRKLLALCNMPLLLFVPLTFIIDESPRWLLQKGRTAEAAKILRKGAEQNNATITSANFELLSRLSEMSKDMAAEKYGDNMREDVNNQGTLKMLKTCFSAPGMRIILLIISTMWFLTRALYVGIVINANNVSGSDPFQYVAISGAFGVLAMVLSIPLSIKLPRRVIVATSLATSGILMILELAIPRDYWWIKWTMIMVAFCLVCGAFQVHYVFAAELFPTVIRTRGFTFANLIGSIGEMSIPLVTDIAVQYLWWAPNVTFGLAGILAGMLVPLLPETKDRPMPETLQDVEDRFWNDCKGSRKDLIVTKGQTTFQV